MTTTTDNPLTAAMPGSASARARLVTALRERANSLRMEAHEAPARLLSQAEQLELWARLIPTEGTWTDVKQIQLEEHALYLIARTSHGKLVQEGVLARWTRQHGWTPIHIDFHHQQEIKSSYMVPAAGISVFLPNGEAVPQGD